MDNQKKVRFEKNANTLVVILSVVAMTKLGQYPPFMLSYTALNIDLLTNAPHPVFLRICWFYLLFSIFVLAIMPVQQIKNSAAKTRPYLRYIAFFMLFMVFLPKPDLIPTVVIFILAIIAGLNVREIYFSQTKRDVVETLVLKSCVGTIVFLTVFGLLSTILTGTS